MERRKLGYTDLELTTIGLGTWAMGGGGWEFGWGAQDDAESVVGHSPGARPGDQLAGYGSRVWAGTLGRGGRACT